MLNSLYGVSKQSGNGSQTAFSGSWKILQASDLNVYKIDATLTQGSLLVNGVDYTLTFDSVQETWTVTYTVAPVSGGFAYITRVSNNQQATSLPREGPAPAKSTEAMIDKCMMLIQEMQASLTLVLIANAPTQAGSFTQLQAIAAAAPTSPFIGIDTGNKLVYAYTGNVNLGTGGFWLIGGGS